MAAAATALLIKAPPAYAYPVETAPLPAATGTFEAGHEVTIGGDGFDPGSQVSIDVYSDPIHLATATANGAGAFSITVTLPPNLSAGSHTLRATGTAPGGGILILSRAFVQGDQGTLPVTGYPLAPLAAVAVVALSAGLGLIGYAHLRSRRSVRSTARAGDGG